MADARHPVSSVCTVLRVRLYTGSPRTRPKITTRHAVKYILYRSETGRTITNLRATFDTAFFTQLLSHFAPFFSSSYRKSGRACIYFDRWRAFYSRAALNAFSSLPAGSARLCSRVTDECNREAEPVKKKKGKNPSAKFTLLPPRPFR